MNKVILGTFLFLCICITRASLANMTSYDEYITMHDSALTQLQTNVPIANQRLKELAEFNIILSKHKVDGRFIIINRREQYIRVYDDHNLIIYEKVIVGKVSRPTRLFNDTITSVVMAPRWSLPRRIAGEYFPKIKKSGGWNGYTIYVDGNIMHINDVDPRKPYRIVQSPGPRNALGSFKFNTKHGKYSIFIHDTPNKELFAKENRRFSSGCIRMQNPEKLASFLLNMSNAKVKSLLSVSKNTFYKNSSPIQMYIVDWKQWIDGGTLVER